MPSISEILKHLRVRKCILFTCCALYENLKTCLMMIPWRIFSDGKNFCLWSKTFWLPTEPKMFPEMMFLEDKRPSRTASEDSWRFVAEGDH